MPKRPRIASPRDVPHAEALGDLDRLAHLSTAPVYTVGTVTQRTGIAPATLRAWERRHGILRPARTGSEYRLYSERDVGLVQWVRDRIEAGLSIGQVAALLQTHVPVDPPAAEGVSTEARTEPAGSPALPVERNADPAGAAAEHVRGLVEAFERFDERAAQHRLGEVFATHTFEQAMERVVRPALVELGASWERGDPAAVAIEHFATNLLRNQFHALLRAAPAPTHGPLVIVGCAPGETHELGPLYIAILLRRNGIRAITLGQDVEPNSLLQVMAIRRPALICLAATLREHVPALAAVARRVEAAGVAFGYGGQPFDADPALRELVPGVYLGAHPDEIVARVRAVLDGDAPSPTRSGG